MGITVDADVIIACLQNITFCVFVIIGSHILSCKGDGENLGFARIQDISLVKGYEICRSLLNSTVCVRRVIVDLHHIFSSGITGVGHRDVKGNLAIVLGDVTHFLAEGSVGQTVSKRVKHGFIIINQSLCRCCLVEAVSYVDALHVVDEGRPCDLLLAGKSGLADLELFHIVINEAAKVIGGRCGG